MSGLPGVDGAVSAGESMVVMRESGLEKGAGVGTSLMNCETIFEDDGVDAKAVSGGSGCRFSSGT
jgi:hypothetical protein